MDFSYTDVQQMLQDSVQKFVQKSYDFDTRNTILNSDKGFSDENWQLFAELGWLAVPFSEEDGGLGGSAVDLMVIMEEFGKANLIEPYTAAAVLSGSLVAELATGEAKTMLVESIIGGELLLASAFAEPGSRFNPGSVATSAAAAADGDDVILNGTKVAVENGPNANKLLVSARESGDVRDAQGISVFVVDASTPGISMRSYQTVDGKMASEVTLTDVKVPASNRLGEAGAALPAIEVATNRAIVAVSAEAVGALEVLLQKTVEYSKTRKQFGTPIGTFQALQHRMADMFIQCQLARSIVIMAAMALDGDDSAEEKARAVAAAKSRIGKAIKDVGQEAIQIHGGIAMTEELDVGHLFKRVTALDLAFGDGDYHTQRFAQL
ncbi:MAG TPA: pimeloyl-CoA dehydrogenase small subunit [Gammaproteobacteria bacterium]|nr:MAG: pimeloyl-CoA dehydrogenase small subunit [Gammaproteobacteria bacterium TMED260]HBQ00966.1 pimeloyl-CoA dehydrogenase small subunit [Gammaproteobacteria bacterium]HCA35246.1 pimeloyl-CoA dehydrogenase small subunit [Gammaproteobacteria bacterium]